MINAANRGYIIIHDKLNDGIKKYVTENNLNIKQVNYSSFKYENIEIAEEIIWVYIIIVLNLKKNVFWN